MPVSFARELEETLHRALGAAQERTHVYATMEHLLLALIDDEHASKVMSACGVDLNELREAVTHYLDSELDVLKADKYFETDGSEAEALSEESETQSAAPAPTGSTSKEAPPSESEAKAATPLTRADYEKGGPSPTSGFQRVVQRSILHVESSGRTEVTGANVLVALFSERESYAVHFLQQQDMSRLDAVAYISHGVGKGEVYEPEETGADEEKLATLLPRVLRYDLRPHSDGVPAEPTLSTRSVAQKIADFLGETVATRALQSAAADRVPLVTVGIFGPWGSGKSTLLSEVGKTLTKDGAIVVFVNTWKWEGDEDVFTFVNRQLLEGISKTRRFKPSTLLLKLMLFVRRNSKKSIALISAFVGLISAVYLVDWKSLHLSSELLSYKSALAAVWAAVAGLLVRPVGTLFERTLLPKQKDIPPGEQLSKTYAYLMLSSRLGLAKKNVVFLFDDLDRCDEARVVRFMQSIHRLTSQGSISIIACDDRFVASAIYHHYKNIADMTGEGKGFGERFLEKTVQVHFRMPNLDKEDLQSLGLHSGSRSAEEEPDAPMAAPAPESSGDSQEPASPALPTKDIGAESQNSVDDASLVEICGDVLSTLITPYRLSIRRAKFLSNLVKLYSMVFQPKDDVSAYRLAAFLMITHVDKEWIPTHFAENVRSRVTEDDFTADMMRYLGSNFDDILKLYAVCGIEPPGSLMDKPSLLRMH